MRLVLLLAALTLLSACGGMNRAVGVLPNTLDDLAAKSRGNSAAAPAPGGPAETPAD
ncbi:hypothetical protein [Aurantimonas sp. VKM B-3413]|uniref:hypothetical protein n=1 Tax=Aurantimonas sp. VKM B-3413 TaxID=2779401 RepID=UPI001E6004A6|nr:hypothetical protein [Aurantimonas sp. VKM B-3413]MCB8840662.1 hypothetical protein [Aurantimonas sp. VKM B-3413]